MAGYKYVLDNAWKSARDRLSQLEKVWDEWTIRNLEKVGVDAGWNCLEIAGGAGSIASWLCNRVGTTGHVLATDIEPCFLKAITAPNLSAQRHDILVDDLPDSAFDLVHARALLTFLPEPDKALRKMVSALKPGGWLLIEEPDYISAIPDPSMSPVSLELSMKGWNALLSHLRSRGYDTQLGRHLYHDVQTAGLVDLEAEGFVAMQLGGSSGASPSSRCKITYLRPSCLLRRNWTVIEPSWIVPNTVGSLSL
jgi:ubiquinone/menaquinone biosynthesis C-methylase UbiE